MRERSVRLALVLFAVGAVAALATAQPPGWGGPRVVHYKVCARCGYKTEDMSEVTCPNCSGGSRRASVPHNPDPAPQYTPPSFSSPPGQVKLPEQKRLTLADNVRLAILIAVGSGILLTLVLGGLFVVNYLAQSMKVKKAVRPARRSRRWDDEDDD